MKQKLPENLHIVYEKPANIKREENNLMSSSLHAEWLENPESWDKKEFIKETTDFLMNVYGSISTQDRHLIGMLAVEITQYVNCVEGIKSDGIIATFNKGKTKGANPYVSIKNDTIGRILMLMNQLGLSPRDRIKNGVKESNETSKAIAKLLEGPLACK